LPHLPLSPRQKPEDVNSLLTIKLALKYANMRDVESMRAIARAHQGRNLADFEKALRDYRDGKSFPLFFLRLLFLFLRSSLLFCSTRPIFNHPLSFTELSSDPTIRSHLAALYDTLLEQNLLRIVEPYSVVEIAYVAETVGQERQAVEAKCVTPLRSFSCDRCIYLITYDGL
jgi:26S proteasome regulatory subunit N6